MSPAADEVPAWAHAPVQVVDPAPEWAELGRGLVADLDVILDPWRIGSVEHIGSTSVPGLAAKPVIDLMVPVHDLAAAIGQDGFVVALGAAGWAHVPPELDGRPAERFFVLPEGARRFAHLHLMDPASKWRDRLAFRDALRADPGRRDSYARLKRELARTHAADREAYTRAKSDFVRHTIAGLAQQPPPEDQIWP